MREIKYRQKLKDAYVSSYGESFHYWGYIDGGFVSPVGLNESDCYSGGAWFGRNQPRTKYRVEYNNYKGGFCFKGTDRQDDSNSMEVIGNIHENKELLCED